MGSLRQWVAWSEQRIGRVVVGEGLAVALAGVTQGPLTVTFRLRLVQASPTALRKLLALGPALAQALQVDNVRIADDRRGILVEVASPNPRTPTAAELAQATNDLTVAVGFDQWRKSVMVNLRDNPALLFVGPTRRGKTQAMKSTLYALARRNGPGSLRFVILAQKRADWEAFAPAAACLAVVTDPSEAVDVMTWAAEDLLQKRAKTATKKPSVVCVLDDLLNLLKRSPDLAAPIGEIASMGAGVGLFQLIGTQDAGSKRGTGGSDVEANITARVVYRASSATGAARAAGAGGLGIEDLSGHKGDALLLVDGHPSRIATGLSDDRLVALLPSGDSGPPPWSKRSQERPGTARTGENDQNAPVLPPLEGDDVTLVMRGEGERGQERPEENAPFLDTTRPPNRDERRRLRALYRDLGSKEKTYFAAWGFKNGTTLDYLNQALQEADEEEPQSNHQETDTKPKETDQGQGDDELDLRTEAGRRLWEVMQGQGLVKLGKDSTETVAYH